MRKHRNTERWKGAALIFGGQNNGEEWQARKVCK
jgi:hypothetical protein